MRHSRPVQYSWSRTGPIKSSADATITKFNKKTGAVTKRPSATTQQALRTGGWANPNSGSELKYVDFIVTTTLTAGVATFTSPYLINGISQGTGANGNRIGRKLIMTKFQLRYSATLNAAGSTGGSPIRIMMIYDKQANATMPNITDILIVDSFLATNQLANRDRFITLMDIITEPLSLAGNFAIAGQEVRREKLEVCFNSGTDATINSITTGSVVVMFAQCGNIAAQNPAISWVSRIRYKDN